MSKPIDWQEQNGLVVYGITPAGDYCIHDNGTYGVMYTPFEVNHHFIGVTLDEAKASCQAHFDAVVKECSSDE